MSMRGVITVFLLSAAALGLSGCPRRPSTAEGGPRCPPGQSPATVVSVVPEPPIAVWHPIAGRTVVLDPGHGGRDNGAAHFGLLEKDINLDLANRAAARLRAKGVTVLMTRESDVFVSLPDRSAFANGNPGAVFVSIHVNASASNPNASGVETFVLSKEFTDAERERLAAGKFVANGAETMLGRQALAKLSTRSRNRGPALAKAVQKSLVGRLGEIDRGVKPGNLAVLRETLFCPAILVETGFLSNSRTADAMRADDWRRRAADGIAEGIVEFLRSPE